MSAEAINGVSMLFVVYCVDKPFSTALRSVTRDEHLNFIRHAGAMVRFAGPLLSDDGGKMTGSLLVVEAETIEEARAWQASDPYQKAGLFERVEIRTWRWTVENGDPRQGT